MDHITEKAEKGSENLRNPWVLCPNCHAKKTYRIIKIDVETKRVTDVGIEIKLIKDNYYHLMVTRLRLVLAVLFVL